MSRRRCRKLLVCTGIVVLAIASTAPVASATGARVRLLKATAELHVETPRFVGYSYIYIWAASDGSRSIEVKATYRYLDADGDLARFVNVRTGDGLPYDPAELEFEMNGLGGATLRGTVPGEICTYVAPITPDSQGTCDPAATVDIDVSWTGVGSVTHGPLHSTANWSTRLARARGSVAGVPASSVGLGYETHLDFARVPTSVWLGL